MNNADDAYLKYEEPVQSTLLALKRIIMNQHQDITQELKYGMPFFCFRGKMFCYLWFHRKYKQPYIGFVEGKYFDQPFLLKETRSRMKIMLIDPSRDLPLERIKSLLKVAINLYVSGIVRT